MPNKTDRNDARALAQIMRTGWFRQVHVKSRQSRLWRSLLVARRTVLNEMRSIENVIRAVLREAGLKLGTPGRAAFAGRVRDLVRDDVSVKPLVEPLLAILATMLEQLAHLTRQLLDITRGEEVCRRLMSVPGVGPTTALTFRATIDRPDRFRRSRDVGAHLGLSPARYQSGEISRCGDELARTALYEAAHTLLVRSRKWSALRAWGMKVAKARGMARARVAVARKLAVILHRMWSTEPNSGSARSPTWEQRSEEERAAIDKASPGRVHRIVHVGTKGKDDLVESSRACEHQPARLWYRLGRLALLTPSCGGLSADREEKRVAYGATRVRDRPGAA